MVWQLVVQEKLHRQLYRETNGDYRRIAGIASG